MLATTAELISQLQAMASRLSALRPSAGAEPRVLETCLAVRATAQELQRWLEARRAPAAAADNAAALLAAAQRLVTAAHQARFDGGDTSAASRLTSEAPSLTAAMCGVLAWWDGLSAAQVAAARRQVDGALSELSAVTSVQRLQPAVKVAVSELRRFAELCQQLGGELPCERSRRLLAAQLRHLLLCAQLLPDAAVCRCVHPLNANAKLPLSLAVRGLTDSAAEAAELLSAPVEGRGRGAAAEPPDGAGDDGGFVRSMDGLLRLLERCRQLRFAEDARPLLEAFLSHALAVAQCAGGEEGGRVSRACQQAAEQFGAAARLQTVRPARRGEFVLACQQLADQLELAEHLTNTALLHLIVDTFTEPTRHLDVLLRVAGEEARADPHRERLEAAVADHDLAADRVFQVCGLATACSTDAAKLTRVRAGLLLLETLEPEVYPAASIVRSAPSDPAGRQHLSSLRDCWRRAVLEMRDCLDEIMDPVAFCRAVEAEQAALAVRMKEMLYDQDTGPLLELAGRVASLGLRLAQFTADQVRGHTDVTEAVLLVGKAVSQLPGSVRAVRERPSDLGAHRLLQKVVQVVVTYVKRLRQLLEDQDERQEEDDEQRDGDGEEGGLLNAAGAASVTLLSDVNQVPVDETPRPYCSRVRSRLAASSRTFNSERSRHGATVGAPTELSLDITKYLSYHSQSHRNASLRLRSVRVDLTPLVPRLPPASCTAAAAEGGPSGDGGLDVGSDSGADSPSPDLLDPPAEMLALDADEVAEELSSLSVLIDAQPAADLSHILDSLSELAAELSQDVRETEQSLLMSAAGHAPSRRPPPSVGRHQSGHPAYVTAGGGAETCPTASCGAGVGGGQGRPRVPSARAAAEAGSRAGGTEEAASGTSEKSSTEC